MPIPAPETDQSEQPPAYEPARDELTDIVRQLESGSANLADCLRLWERGEYLASVCQTHLDTAIQRVEHATSSQPEPAGQSAPEQ